MHSEGSTSSTNISQSFSDFFLADFFQEEPASYGDLCGAEELLCVNGCPCGAREVFVCGNPCGIEEFSVCGNHGAEKSFVCEESFVLDPDVEKSLFRSNLCDAAIVHEHSAAFDHSAAYDHFAAYDHSGVHEHSVVHDHSVAHDHSAAHNRSAAHNHSAAHEHLVYDHPVLDDSVAHNNSVVHDHSAHDLDQSAIYNQQTHNEFFQKAKNGAKYEDETEVEPLHQVAVGMSFNKWKEIDE
ncbi:hypothetical protein C2G38_2040653 [Gigaspora rosea]|uniref:Uncharacterized protein n=1 Tax=Gigaspora rosea TaxID=44941 RepID=A0A397UUP6_9GLOM|nr:hypothetical protein C2G38_2040653 [Gigaspora rosea]